ncbi:hypothetical protein [Weissella cibaria]|uniref:hypothetical protein n=1 Tax=Weissella cibaria TaxID=137591 RepID=UPI0013DBACE0|nr:hypothetical protein [Weissella cibaria]NFA03277.1 hypothetical protein [Weissella cibaria]
MDDRQYSPRISQVLQQEWVVSGAFKNRQHAAWPALFRKAHTDLEGLGGIICPAEWRPRHSVAEFLNKGAGYNSLLLLVRQHDTNTKMSVTANAVTLIFYTLNFFTS